MISEKDRLLVYMSICEISNKKQEQIINVLEDFSLEKVLDNKEVESILSVEEYHKLLKNYDRQKLDMSIENMLNNDIKILTIFNENYPQKLIDLPDRPLILYAKGDLSLLEKKSIAIVGTRSPSNYGKIVTEKLSGEIAQSGLVVISGLCFGVDEISHRKTLDVGGKTIAVVGGGFKKIYPATNTVLSEQIAEKGLLLSEYPPSFEPKRYTFPRRNRIIAGLADGILITEAGFKSGTTHTKEYAQEYGKDLFAVPGNITSNKSELTNMLIQTGQAECVISAENIIKQYGMSKKESFKRVVFEPNFEQQELLNLLADGEKNFDYLAEKTKIPVNSLNFYLTTLEINGLIRKLPSQFYALLN